MTEYNSKQNTFGIANNVIQNITYGIPQDELDRKTEIRYDGQLKSIWEEIQKGAIKTARSKLELLESEFRNGEVKEAKTKFKILAYIAQTYLNTREEKKAAEYLIEASKYDDEEERKHRNIALAYSLRGNGDEAIEEIETSIRIAPEKPVPRMIKAIILQKIGDFEKVIKYLESKTIDHEGYYYYLANSYLIMQNYEKSLKETNEGLSKYPESENLIYAKGEALLSLADRDLKEDGIYDETVDEYLEEALKFFNKYLEIINNEEEFKKAHALCYRGLVYYLQRKFDDSLKDLTQSNDLLPDDPFIQQHLLMHSLLVQNREKALGYIDKIKNLEKENINPEILLIESKIYIGTGRINEAIEILEDSISKQVSENLDFRFHENLVLGLYTANRTSEAYSKLEDYIKTYGDIGELILTKAKILSLEGKNEEFIEFVEEKIKKTKGRTKTELSFMFANVLCLSQDIGRFKRAANIFEEIANFYWVKDPALQGYVIALYRSNQIAKCLEVCGKIQGINGPYYFFSNYEARIYYETENYHKAIEKLDFLCRVKPSNPKYKFFLAASLNALGKNKEAVEIVYQIENKLGDTREEYEFLSKAFAYIKAFDKSLTYAWKALEKEPDDADTQLFFFFKFQEITSNAKDNIKIPEEYIKRWQEIGLNFEKDHPDRLGIRSINVPLEPEAMIEWLENVLIEKENSVKEFESIYMQNKMPLYFYSVMGNSIVSAWSSVVNSRSLKLWFNSQDPRIISQELNNAEEATDILIGPVAILTLDALKLLGELKKVFEEVFITQSTFLVFESEKERLEKEKQIESFSAWSDNGKIYKMELPQEIYEKNIKWLNGIIGFIEDSCKIVGKSIKRSEVELDEKDKLVQKALGNNAVEILLESKYRNTPLYDDDYRLREHGVSEYGISGFSSFSVLKKLLNKGLITQGIFNESAIDLLGMNYSFIPVNVVLLKHSLEKPGLGINEYRRSIPFEALKDRIYQNDNYLLEAFLKFLKYLWLETGFENAYREKWMIKGLDCICYN
ncbi:MAG: hypothetical protein J7L43_00220, partial [Candidatus Aenigmarchaeota archaeon]|nr:hypothetical protein [Candidatus Aenigmarchaeota archaeon]